MYPKGFGNGLANAAISPMHNDAFSTKLLDSPVSNLIYGMKVVVNDAITRQQKVKIRDTFEYITDEGRARINQYLADTFGFEDKIFCIGNNTVVISTVSYDKIKHSEHMQRY